MFLCFGLLALGRLLGESCLGNEMEGGNAVAERGEVFVQMLMQGGIRAEPKLRRGAGVGRDVLRVDAVSQQQQRPELLEDLVALAAEGVEEVIGGDDLLGEDRSARSRSAPMR